MKYRVCITLHLGNKRVVVGGGGGSSEQSIKYKIQSLFYANVSLKEGWSVVMVATYVWHMISVKRYLK